MSPPPPLLLPSALSSLQFYRVLEQSGSVQHWMLMISWYWRDVTIWKGGWGWWGRGWSVASCSCDTENVSALKKKPKSRGTSNSKEEEPPATMLIGRWLSPLYSQNSRSVLKATGGWLRIWSSKGRCSLMLKWGWREGNHKAAVLLVSAQVWPHERDRERENTSLWEDAGSSDPSKTGSPVHFLLPQDTLPRMCSLSVRAHESRDDFMEPETGWDKRKWCQNGS